jgi:hypothetical protein
MVETLVVVRAFRQYQVGSVIDDAKLVQEMQRGEYAHSVMRVGAPSRLATKRQEV